MSVEGGAAGAPQGEAPQWYYVVTGGFKKGPYRVEQLRASVEAMTLTTADLVRAEGEIEGRALGEVLARLAERDASETRARSADAGRARQRAPIDLNNAYAPPSDDADQAPVVDARPLAEQGNYALGFALGFFGGCIALAFGGSVKPQTRKGMIMGFGVSTILGVIQVFAMHR